MADYGLMFSTLGAELKNQRKAEAVFEDFHFTSSANFAKRLVGAVYDSTDVYQEAAKRAAANVYETSVAPTMQNLFSVLRQAFENGWFPVLDNQINTNPTDRSIGAIQYTYDGTLSDGTEAILSRGGRWGALRQRMIADRMVILKNTLTFGSLVPVGTPQGSIVLTTISGEDHALSGVLSLICSDDTVGAQKFSLLNTLSNKLADPTIGVSQDGLFSILQPDNPLTLGKIFQDGQLGITMKIDSGPLIITDAQAVIDQITFGPPTVTNPTEADTNKGKIYLKIIRQAADPVWIMNWYSDAAQTQLVAQGFAPHSTPSFFLAGAGGTSIVVNLNTTNADLAMPSAGNFVSGIILDIGAPRVNDQWDVTVTNAENGLFATKIARRYRASLNSASAKPSAAPSAALAGAGAGNVTNGTHTYTYAYVVNGVETGESAASGIVTVVDNTVNGKVSLTGVTVGPAGTTARRIYRTIAGNTGNYLLVGTINDNVTTTFTDNVADGSLGVAAVQQIDDTQATSVSMT